MSELTKTIKELTGEDAVDIFGGDAENIIEELNEPRGSEEYMIDRKDNCKPDGRCKNCKNILTCNTLEKWLYE